METKSCLHMRLHSGAVGGGLMPFMLTALKMLSSKCETQRKMTFELTPGNLTRTFSRDIQHHFPHLTCWLPAETGMNFIFYKSDWEDLKAKHLSFTSAKHSENHQHPRVRITLAVHFCPQQLRDWTEVQSPWPLSPLPDAAVTQTGI